MPHIHRKKKTRLRNLEKQSRNRMKNVEEELQKESRNTLLRTCGAGPCVILSLELATFPSTSTGTPISGPLAPPTVLIVDPQRPPISPQMSVRAS